MTFLLLLALAQPDAAKDDLAAFKQYLEKNHKGKKWGAGPSAIDSKEIQQAYPDLRFYFVFSASPLPPGAPLPELIERHRRAVEDFQKNYISLTVVKDKDGFRALTRENLGKGLMPVKNEDDAKVAAAAVLSVLNDRDAGPAAIAAKEVMVEKTEKGWTCTAVKQFNFQGTAEFDADGKFLRASKASIRPLPPSAPPPRR